MRSETLVRIGKRSLSYVWKGYSIASLPFAFFGYASSIYYLAITNISYLHDIFPHFSDFLVLAAVTLPIFCGLVGYIYMKRSWLFRADVIVQTESNPYVYKSQPGKEIVMLPYQALWTKVMLRMLRNFDIVEPGEEQAFEEYVQLLEYLAEGGDIRTFERSK